MAKTEIPSEQISNDDVRREDLNTSTPGDAVTTKITVGGIGISESHSGADVGTGDVNLTLQSGGFGMNKAWSKKQANETTTGNSWAVYDTLDFTVTDSAVNEFRVNVDFFWGHSNVSNDIRVQFLLDGNLIGNEMRVEPKDAGSDQRYQNNILDYLTNLSLGDHTLTLRYRPATNNRISRLYYSIIEAWRIA